jgi:hypothetical protein
MNNRLQQLRDAVVSRGREVEVTPSGEVRDASRDPKPENDKPTKLAPRTFGA